MIYDLVQCERLRRTGGAVQGPIRNVLRIDIGEQSIQSRTLQNMDLEFATTAQLVHHKDIYR